MGEPASSFPYPILREVTSMCEQLESVCGGPRPNDMTEGRSSEVVTPMPEEVVGEGNSNHSTWSSAALHPLHNPVILTHLFELCPSDLLSQLRLVSREWHCLSLAHWRSSFPLTIRYRNDEDIFLINPNETSHMNYALTLKCPILQFLEHLQNPANHCATKPFRQLLIQFWNFKVSLVPQAGPWNILGQGVANLTLEFCKFKGIGGLCQFVHDWFPNLRSLFLSRCYLQDRGSPEDSNVKESVCGGHLNLKSLSVTLGSSIDWVKLLSNFPSLTSLSMVGSKDDIEIVLHVIATIKRIDKSKLPIKNLNLRPELKISSAPASLEKFLLCQQLNLHLQSIRFLVYPNLEERVIEETLRFHGDTLRKITALEDPSNPIRPSRWKFPFNVKLERLQKLKISGSLLESLEFLKYTPNLVRLVILDPENTLWEPPRNTGTQIVSNTLKYHGLGELELTRLTVFHLCYAVSDDDLGCLIKWMPNMKDLSMVLSDKQFGMVCDGWRHLTELEVQGPELTDLGVTGIDHYQDGGDTEGNMGAVGGTTSPNITLLQELRLFDCWSRKLTEASVFNGFLKLANLEFLQLHSPCSDPERMVLGDDAKTALEDKLELDMTCFCDKCEFL